MNIKNRGNTRNACDENLLKGKSYLVQKQLMRSHLAFFNSTKSLIQILLKFKVRTKNPLSIK